MESSRMAYATVTEFDQPGVPSIYMVMNKMYGLIMIINNAIFLLFIVPPTLKKLTGHFGVGFCVCPSVHQKPCMLGF